jgi:1-aminocyclopropane-1-carboxylate deaminase
VPNISLADIAKKLEINSPSPLVPLVLDINGSAVKVWCKRDDLLHPVISGNKWRKLQDILSRCASDGISHIGSFGGAYSNHIHALAFACYRLNITFTAFIRAHVDSDETPTLRDIRQWGAQIHFLNRIDYRKRDIPEFIAALKAQHKIELMIPEGGSQSASLSGVGNILDELKTQSTEPFDAIILPVASGGTMAGLIHYIHSHQLPTRVIGIAVLKGEDYLESKVIDLLTGAGLDLAMARAANWEIVHHSDIHAGGYAKCSKPQHIFKDSFVSQHKIQLDRIYNIKSFFALHHLLTSGNLALFKRILILHTGGLQGDRS